MEGKVNKEFEQGAAEAFGEFLKNALGRLTTRECDQDLSAHIFILNEAMCEHLANVYVSDYISDQEMARHCKKHDMDEDFFKADFSHLPLCFDGGDVNMKELKSHIGEAFYFESTDNRGPEDCVEMDGAAMYFFSEMPSFMEDIIHEVEAYDSILWFGKIYFAFLFKLYGMPKAKTEFLKTMTGALDF